MESPELLGADPLPTGSDEPGSTQPAAPAAAQAGGTAPAADEEPAEEAPLEFVIQLRPLPPDDAR